MNFDNGTTNATVPDRDETLMLDESADALRIGSRLRALRTERGLTILDLATKAGVAAGSISQIERGSSNPSFSTLQKLRSVLGVTLWAFLESDEAVKSEESPHVRRRNNRPCIVFGVNQLTKELLSPRGNEDLRFMILTVPPGGKSEDALSGPGDKGGYVLSGKIELTIGGEVVELEEGDSFQFKSTIPHQIENRWTEEAKLIWIIHIEESHL